MSDGQFKVNETFNKNFNLKSNLIASFLTHFLQFIVDLDLNCQLGIQRNGEISRNANCKKQNFVSQLIVINLIWCQAVNRQLIVYSGMVNRPDPLFQAVNRPDSLFMQ